MTHPTERRNRLAAESSPYLLLHQHNPVDWYPWGPEALARARSEDRPIFLSVGYSTCYWCHVMERESFVDPRIAELLNQGFVAIKVDREERPDLDEIYMSATQILTGQGGWPNSVFLTPELKPFFAGTYFPPADSQGQPGFSTVLHSLAEAWRTRRADVEEQAEEVAAAMRRYLAGFEAGNSGPPGAEPAERSLANLRERFDAEWGGFGGAPKFPSPANLYLLAEFAGERPEAALMLDSTLDQMARGGIFDQLGGGFHRYATDRRWRVPHFEKMLYDNGQLLELLAGEHARTGAGEWARVARETADFLIRELGAPEGGFWSAIDAETDGEEGSYYVWSRGELDETLGAEDAAFLAPLLGFAEGPNFEGGRYVLHLPVDLGVAAGERRMERAEVQVEMAPLKARLFAARGHRRRPATDDKVLADWNGTAIAGLAIAGHVLGEESYVERSVRAAEFVLQAMRPAGGPLLHSWRGGETRVAAFLLDYALLSRGLLALHRVTGAERWLAAARELTEEQIARLRAPDGGFFNATAAPDLLLRAREVFDGALPAANGVAVLNLLELAAATGERRWSEEAEAALTAFSRPIELHPEGARMLALAAWRRHRQAAQHAAAVGEIGHAASAATATGSVAPGDSAVANLERQARELVSPRLELSEPAADGFRSFHLHLTVAAGWHLQAHPASLPELVATELSGEGVDLRALAYPAGKPWRPSSGEDEISVYEDAVEISGMLRPTGSRESRPTLRLRFQLCDQRRCLPPVELVVPLESDS